MRRIDGVRHVVAPLPPTTEFLTERREAVRRRVDHLHDAVVRHEHQRDEHDGRDDKNHYRVLLVPFDDPVDRRLPQKRRKQPAGRKGERVVLWDLCAKRSVSPSRRPRDLCTDDHEAHDPHLGEARGGRDEDDVGRRGCDRLWQTTKLDQQRPEDHASPNTEQPRRDPREHT